MKINICRSEPLPPAKRRKSQTCIKGQKTCGQAVELDPKYKDFTYRLTADDIRASLLDAVREDKKGYSRLRRSGSTSTAQTIVGIECNSSWLRYLRTLVTDASEGSDIWHLQTIRCVTGMFVGLMNLI